MTNVTIGMVNPKFPHNVGAAIRAASCFNVGEVRFSGSRVSLVGDGKKYRLPREERMKGYKKVSLENTQRLFDGLPSGTVPVGIEIREGAQLLPYFEHPENALYVFGPEDGSLGRGELVNCYSIVQLPMAHCANLASTIYMVLYDRHMKRVLAGLEQPISLDENRGWEETDSMCEAVGVM